MSEILPSRIGAYRVITKLGEGGMAKVYLGMALKGKFRKLVVIKLLNGECAAIPEAREMFLEEAELAARLNHPNVVSTFEVGDDELGQFIAMEYLEGQSYSALMRKVGRSQLALEHHLKVLIDVLAGLQYAHEFVDYDGTHLGIVHRDVTPQNVFVTYDGQVKLVDFGVAKAACQNHETRAGVIKGKLAYLAPEQATGAPLDRRADLFAVGVMLWEALAGRRLASGSIDVAIIHNRVNGLEPRIREVAPEVPPALAEICDRAMALHPEDRFATARELGDALQAALESLPDRSRLTPIGGVVCDAFAAERSEIRTTVEQHTRASDGGAGERSSVTTLSRPIAAHTPSSEGHSKADATDANAATVVPESPPAVARGPSRARTYALAGAALVAAIALVAVTRKGAESSSAAAPVGAGGPSAATTSAASKVSASASSPAAGTIDLRLSATPSEATLTLDGVTVDGNPFRTKIDRDDRMHVVRATAPGYAPLERAISFAADAEVALALSRAAAPPVAGPRPGAVTAAPASAANSTPTAASPTAAPAPTTRGTAQAGDDLRGKPAGGRRNIDEKDPYSQ